MRIDQDLPISVVIPLLQMDQDLVHCLRSLAALADETMQVLLVAMGPAEEHLVELGELGRRLGLEVELLNQPSLDWAEAANLGLSMAKGQVMLFMSPHLGAPANLRERLREHFRDAQVSAVGGGLAAYGDAPDPARLSVHDFAFRTADLAGHDWPVLFAHCVAFDRHDLLAAGGMAPGEGQDGGPLPTPCLQLAEQGRSLVFDPALAPLTRQPVTWGQYLSDERRVGRTLFMTRRQNPGEPGGLLSGNGMVLQPLLAFAAMALPAMLLYQAPGNAVTLSALVLLLLYPLNRTFLKTVAREEPGLLNKAVVMCLARPFAWLWGMAASALGRLGGR